jgi:Skp family chaperone for outer membrane proteins
MKVVKMSIVAGALMLALAAPVFAQTAPPAGAPKPQAPPAGAPKPQTPPATPPAAAPAAPKPAPAPPVPFPQDSKIAFVDMNVIAQNSSAGKDASKKLQEFQTRKVGELSEKNKQLTAMTTRRDTGTAALNDSARVQLDKDIDKLQRDIQFQQQNAQAEFQDLQTEVQNDFQKRLVPVIDEVAKEKGLYAIYSIADSGAAYVHPGLDLSAEITKRLDAKK